ncbi:MAG TPA: hypothetical protein PLR60_11185, partial [Syntrophorhabdaceae bacterium]|nr:hypothetical protein [Syntrophorhabdaceae bacterium]
ERILMHSPTQKSFIRVGAPNDPATSEEYEGHSFIKGGTGIKESTDGWLDVLVGGKNEVILGELFSLITGLRGWFTGGLLTDCVLGGLWEIQVPDRLKLRNGHMNVTAENFKVYVNRTVTRLSKERFEGEQTRITAQVNTAVGKRMRATASNTRLNNISLNSSMQKTETVASHLEAHDENISAIATDLDNAALKLQSMGDQITAAGTQMKESGINIDNAGNHLESAGAQIKSGGLAIQGAPMLIQD